MSHADTVSPPPPPTQADVAAALRLVEPIRKVIKPKVYGIDRMPTKRALLVGNHNLLGVVDMPLICAELWERGKMVRGLADHAHCKVPGWRDLMTRVSAVQGTRALTSELMRRGELVMVFPGGGREVSKQGRALQTGVEKPNGICALGNSARVSDCAVRLGGGRARPRHHARR